MTIVVSYREYDRFNRLDRFGFAPNSETLWRDRSDRRATFIARCV